MTQKLLRLLFSALALTVVVSSQSHARGDAPDALFNQGHWREALQGYQAQFRSECLGRKIIDSKPDSFSSTLVETDSDSLLKAHCLFERGALAFLKKDNESATREWVTCRDALKTIPAGGDLYLRRVNMALAQTWVQSLPTKDLQFFYEGLDQICQVIDDAPLPESTAEFRNQFQQEYRLIFARAVFSAIPQLTSQGKNEALSMGMVSQKLTELWSKKALYKLLSDETVNTSKSHEALVDKVLFANDISTDLCKKLVEASSSIPAPVYSDMAALLCIFNAESMPDGRLDILGGLDRAKLDRNRFGNVVYGMLKIASEFPAANSDAILQGISKHLDLVSWPNPEARIEVATWMAKAGCGKEALNLLQTNDIHPGSPMYPRLCAALTQIYYFVGDFNAALSSGSSLSEKSSEAPAELYYWQGLSYAKLRKNGSAIEALKTFISKAPAAEEAPEACFFLGTLCLSSGKKAEAQHYFQQTIVSYAGTNYAERAKQFSKMLNK